MEKYMQIHECYRSEYMFDVVEDRDRIWFSCAKRNGLCEVDKRTGRLNLIAGFEHEDMLEWYLYKCIEKIGDKLVMIPAMASEIAIYDLSKRRMSYIKLEEIEDCRGKFKFANSMVVGNNIYMLGWYYPAIVKLDVSTGEIEYITDWLRKIKNRIVFDVYKIYGYFSNGIIDRNIAWITFASTNALLKLDLETGYSDVVTINTETLGLGQIIGCEGEFLLSGIGKGYEKLFYLNIDKEVEEIYVLKKAEDDFMKHFEGMIDTSEYIYIFTNLKGNVYILDKRTGTIEACRELERIIAEEHPVTCVHQNEDYIRFVTIRDCKWHEYNYRNEEVHEYKIEFSEDTLQKRYSEYFGIDRVIDESVLPLAYYCEALARRKVQDSVAENAADSVGKRIYDACI